MTTLLHRLSGWAESEPGAIAQTYKHKGERKVITSREFCNRVYWLALFFEAQGMGSQDVGTLFSYNCPEWVHVDLATALIGAKSAGIYPNSSPKDIAYILNHTETRFLSVQSKEYYNKIIGENRESLVPDRIQMILVFDGDTTVSPKAISYEAALAQGKKLASSEGAKKLSDYLAALDPDAPAFMIYTSGTTSKPKGALISHSNLVYTIDQLTQFWGLPMGEGSLFSFLPLCHIAEKFQNVACGISKHYTVHFCSKFENVGVELAEVEPSLLLCVPRLWEKMMEGVMHKVNQSRGFKKRLALWALHRGAERAKAKYSKKVPSVVDQIQWQLADQLVLSKIRKALGLGKAEALASGAAALSPHIARWFSSLGLEIMEVFGQTESTGVIFLTERYTDSVGTVGIGLPGVEIKLAEDGEIFTRGKHVFKGYFKDPGATAQTLEGGWLRTGDLGEYDSRGLMKIKGRKKEILKTSGGKMVAPLPIEEALKSASIISQVCVVGDGRKFLSALITLSESKLKELASSQDMLSGSIISSPKVVEEVGKYVESVNATLASFEQIKRFTVLTHEFSIEQGEMTPTLKMKRNVIESRYQNVIDAMYAS